MECRRAFCVFGEVQNEDLVVLCNAVCPVCFVHSADCVSSLATVRSNTVAVVLGMPAFTGCPDYRGGRVAVVSAYLFSGLHNEAGIAMQRHKAVYAVLLVPVFVVLVLALLPASCVPVLAVL